MGLYSKWSPTGPIRDTCLSHVDSVAHICVTKFVSDNGVSPVGRQTIIWTNARSLLIGTFGTNFDYIWNKMKTFSSSEIYSMILPTKRWSYCFSLNILKLTHSAYVLWTVTFGQIISSYGMPMEPKNPLFLTWVEFHIKTAQICCRFLWHQYFAKVNCASLMSAFRNYEL